MLFIMLSWGIDTMLFIMTGSAIGSGNGTMLFITEWEGAILFIIDAMLFILLDIDTILFIILDPDAAFIILLAETMGCPSIGEGSCMAIDIIWFLAFSIMICPIE